jgi:mannose-6-phosphate isomerase
MKLYPLSFTPILKERIWGGTKLQTVLHKSAVSKNVGESWELSAVSDDISVVNNGAAKGKTLTQLIDEYPEAMLGEKVLSKFGKQFPLLFKFIDAKEDLSIQVHPNDQLAQERHQSFGKTEMWYIMQADENARLIVGFNKESTQTDYLSHLQTNSLTELLKEYPVQTGDVFFLETGTIHAIGAGILLAEIQQTSDITYRLYDWGRVDDKGVARELHTDLALEAINYNTTKSKVTYDNVVENKLVTVVDSVYFKTNYLQLSTSYSWIKKEDVFTVFMCVEGKCTLTHEGELFSLVKGQTILIPASVTHFLLEGRATLLEISI